MAVSGGKDGDIGHVVIGNLAAKCPNLRKSTAITVSAAGRKWHGYS